MATSAIASEVDDEDVEFAFADLSHAKKSLVFEVHPPERLKALRTLDANNHALFIAARAYGLGSTDKTKLAGYDAYVSPFHCFCSLRGLDTAGVPLSTDASEGVSDKLAAMAAHGHRTEPLGAALYEALTGFDARATGVWQHHTHFWSHSSPDRLVTADYDNAAFEVATLLRDGRDDARAGALELKSNIYDTKDPTRMFKYTIQMQVREEARVQKKKEECLSDGVRTRIYRI